MTDVRVGMPRQPAKQFEAGVSRYSGDPDTDWRIVMHPNA
jgi:hypothetical protein